MSHFTMERFFTELLRTLWSKEAIDWGKEQVVRVTVLKTSFILR